MWRTEPTSVETYGDDLWIAEKFQSNWVIAGSPRNSFKASLGFSIYGGRALNECGGFTAYQALSNSEYHIYIPGVRLREISSVVKRETAQIYN